MFSNSIMLILIMISPAWLEIFVQGRMARKLQVMSQLGKGSPVWEISIASSKAVIKVLAVVILIHYQLSLISLLKKCSKDGHGWPLERSL